MSAPAASAAPPDLAVRLLFRGTAGAVRQTLSSVHAVLVGEQVQDDDRAAAELVLAEVLNNIVEHAYAGRAGGMIELTLVLSGGTLACRVWDSGLPYPGGAPPGDGLRAQDPQDLPEGGFGWPLIHRLTRNLDYHRACGRNHLGFQLAAARRG